MTNTAPDRSTANGVIAIRVNTIQQLFDTLDPFPFPDRDLDPRAEEFITGWARELPRKAPIRIDIHLPAAEMQSEECIALPETIRRYYAYRMDAVAGDLRELFRIGRVSLVIGLVALAVALALSQMAARQLGDTAFRRFAEEGLIIVGWVANWRPIEIFLYEWWPIVRRRNLYRRLANADVQIRPA